MENASKALLIAASVLIVILLIAFGVRIFNSTSGSAEQVEGTMQTAETTMFNNKFIQYQGERKSLNDIKSLANLVIAHNANNTNRKVSLDIYIQSPYAYCNTDVANTISTTVGKLTSNEYNVYIYYSNDGYVCRIGVRLST